MQCGSKVVQAKGSNNVRGSSDRDPSHYKNTICLTSLLGFADSGPGGDDSHFEPKACGF